MKRKLFPMFGVVLVFCLAACGGQEQTLVPGTEVRSDKQRVTEPDATDVPALVSGNTGFALDLYRELAGEDGNLFFSPHSISVALAMTWAGARGETEAQMADALGFTLGQDRLHPACDWLDLALQSRGQGASGKAEEPFRLHVINRLFGQTGYQFLAPFLDTLAMYYGAGMHLLDFAADTEGSRQVINQWVAEQTKDLIEELIPQGVITGMTRLVLVNAIYFNAAWKQVFNDQATQDGIFHKLDGSEVTVPMMRRQETVPRASGEDFDAVELDYDGDELSMVVILPKQDFAAFEQSLDQAKIESVFAGLGGGVTLSMPRFTIDGASFSLVDILQRLGMTDAFVGGTANLSGMDGSQNLYIQDILHQAFVSVDEYGTEAAAATAVIVGETSAPEHLSIDRPFLFLIRDKESKAILFLGRVVDPS